MPSNRAIKNAFALLTSAGVRPPDDWSRPVAEGEPKPAATTARVWQETLPELEDDELIAATKAYLRTASCAFWPQPGTLLALLPHRAADPADDGDRAFGVLVELFRRHGRGNPPRTSRYMPPKAHRIRDRFTKAIREWIPPEDPPWFLDADPVRRNAMERGLDAVGGWDALDQPDALAAHRAAFRHAFTATIAHHRAGERIAAAGLPPLPAPAPLKLLEGDAADADLRLDRDASRAFVTELARRKAARDGAS